VVGTLRVDETLRSAPHIRVSNVVLDTPAGPGSVPGAALSIGPAGRGVAGVDDLRSGDDLRQERTAGERISGVAGGAGTDGVVIDSSTASIVTTGSHTGVSTLLGYTGLAGRTLGIEDTLRSAVGRNSYEAWQAGTGLVTIDFSALSIWSTG
jgi:hypothetical protein